MTTPIRADNNQCRLLLQAGDGTIDLRGLGCKLEINNSGDLNEPLSSFTLTGYVTSTEHVVLPAATGLADDAGGGMTAEPVKDAAMGRDYWIVKCGGKVREVSDEAVKRMGLAEAALLAFALDDDDLALMGSTTPRGDWAHRLQAALVHHSVPDHLRPGLLRWVLDGIPPGGFLKAVIANDLLDACARGDSHARAENWAGMQAVVFWLQDCPAGSFGPRALKTWKGL